MANKFHICGGFLFSNLTVDNTNGVFLLDVKKNATAQKQTYNFIVPNRNGSTTHFNRYDDNYIDLVVGFYDKNVSARRLKQRAFINKIINKVGILRFLDDTNFYYKAEQIDAIEETEDEIFTILTIHFKASWCKYGLYREVKLLVGANEMYNLGNTEAENIIEILALTNCESITIGNGIKSFTLKNLLANEKIYIDSEKQIAYTIVDNVKQNAMTRFSGKFIKIPTSKSTMTLDGTNYSADVNVKYNYMYLGM